MKKLGLSLLLISNAALAFNFANAKLIQDFMALLNDDIAQTDTNLRGLNCGDSFDNNRIICSADLEFFDADANDGSSELCTEVYSYEGGKSFDQICSTCSDMKETEYYNKSCSIELTKEENYVADELIKFLDKDIYMGHIDAYERPSFQASYKTDTGIIEIYKLNYTAFIYGDGTGQINSEQDAEEEIIGTEKVCEYITYSPDDGDYNLTGVSCDKPMDKVTEIL